MDRQRAEQQSNRVSIPAMAGSFPCVIFQFSWAALRPTSPHMQSASGEISLGVKRSRHEAEDTSSSSA